MYVDGEYDNSKSGTFYNNNNGLVTRIGERYNGAGDFQGKIDEVRVWNVSYNAQQVKQLYMMDLQKINAKDYVLTVNQTGQDSMLLNGTYTYQSHVKDIYNNWNNTEERSLTVGTIGEEPEPPATTCWSLQSNKLNLPLSCKYGITTGSKTGITKT